MWEKKDMTKAVIKGLGVSILVLTAACGPRDTAPEQNVILITLDTLRADFVGVYGNPQVLTPNMDSFAAQGTVYENAYSPIPITQPAHASLFYSLPPHRLGLYNNGQIFTPQKGWMSLAQAFRSRGAQTAAFVSLGVLQSRFGLNPGFETYWDEQHPQRWYRTAAEVNDQVFSWLEQNHEKPFFLWIHYSDPHDPYAPPTLPPDLRITCNGQFSHEFCLEKREQLSLHFQLEPGENLIQMESLQPFPAVRDDYRVSLNDILFLNSEALEITVEQGDILQRGQDQILAFRDKAVLRIQNPHGPRLFVIKAQGNLNLFPSELKVGYRREVAYLDQEIGRLKNKLLEWGLLDKSLVVLAGDHGEGLGEDMGQNNEAYFGHIHYLQNIYTKIPLIVCDPSSGSNPARVKSPVSLLDIAPTILQKMGWKSLSFHSGQPLPEKEWENKTLLFLETYSPEAFEDRFGMLSGPWHLIFTPSQDRFQLYQIGKNPLETQNVYEMFKEEPAVQQLIEDLIEKAGNIQRSKKKIELDPESLKMLKSLGYIR